MKKRPFHDPDDHPGGGQPVSAQTVEDLALVESRLAEAERLRADAVAALARVDARGDGSAAVGMPVDQWLRWQTNQHGVVITGIGNLLDVWNDLPTVRQALLAGDVCLDQAIAVARPAARVSRDLRAELNAALADESHWHLWDPQMATVNVERLLDELRPAVAEDREETADRRQWLHLEPHLDGQGIRFNGSYEGVDASLFDSIITEASDTPKAGVPRGRQRAQGLLRVLRDWATGQHRQGDDATDHRSTETGDNDGVSRPAVMIHLLVEEDHQSDGHAATVLSRTRGFSPRLTQHALDDLTDGNPDVTTVTTFTRDGVPVAVKGRPGHAIDDPANLSEDTTRELVLLRQGVCAAPGCSNPINDYHHIIWRVRGGTDDPSNRAGLCPRCHHRVVHGHDWTITVNADGSTTWTLGARTVTVPARHRRILRRAAPRAPDPDEVPLDDDGDPLPF